MDKDGSTQLIAPPSKGPFWSRFFKNDKHLYKIFGLILLAWIAFDTGRVVSNIQLLPLSQKTEGSLTVQEMMNKVKEHPGGRLVLLEMGSQYQDALGKTWFVEDVKDHIRPSDIKQLKEDRVIVDGSLGFSYYPSSKTKTNLFATMFTGILANLAILGLYGLIGWLIFKTMGGSKSKRFSIIPKNSVSTKFADVAGHEHAKKEIMEVVDFLNNPEKYEKLGAKAPRGVLLNGEPGNGKTLLARAIAGESGAAFIEQTGSSFVDKFVGEGASSVRALFKEARKQAPCVIFIDEIDAVGGNRESGHEERRQTLNQLLYEMDGFLKTDKIVVVAATNLIHTLDPALTREGRLGKHIYIQMPSIKDREEILRLNLIKLPNYDVDAKLWSERTRGFSGALLTGLVEGAAMQAVREGASTVTDKHMSMARDRIVIGLPQNRDVNPDILRRVAYHELGHAVVSIVLGSPVEKVTVEPRGGALGVTVIEGKDDALLETEMDVRKDLAMMMGGRAAEALFIGEITGGASNDMQRASERARHAVKIMGLGGMAPYIPAHTDLDVNIEKYASAWVHDSYETATQILTQFQEPIHKIKETLLDEKTISGNQVQDVLNDYLKDDVTNKDWIIKTFSDSLNINKPL